jgi:SAM-dependent methyltransferase
MGSATDYDPLAAVYAAEVDRRSWNALYERPATLSLLPDVAGLVVLDAGCGPGWYADWLARHEAQVVAVDISPRMAEIAQARLGSRGMVHAADMGDLRHVLPDAALDLIVCSLAIHYVAALEPLFIEWARLLKPGGRLVFSTHHPLYDPNRIRDYMTASLVEEQWRWLGSVRFYHRPLSGITEPLSNAGFVVERLVEPRPNEALRAVDPAGFERLCRMPAFLLVRAKRA